MADRVIANALVFFDDDWSAPNVTQLSREESRRVYLKNCYCSLRTAGWADPLADLVLVHCGEIPPDFRTLFEGIGVRLEVVPHELFRVPDHFPWRAGYYKLDVLVWLSTRWDQVLLLDTDTVVVGNLADLWADAADRVMLFETGHRLGQASRADINDLGRALSGNTCRAFHWGGEIVAGSGQALVQFVAECSRWFRAMATNWAWFDNHRDQGDEMILSLSAEALPQLVRPANPYLERYWTNDGFRLVSLNWKYNPVDIWHLPLEKKDGILRLFDILCERDTLPDREFLARLLHLEYRWGKRLFLLIRDLKRAFERLWKR